MKYFLLGLLLSFAGAASADTEGKRYLDLNEMIAETRFIVDLANAGQYGPLSRRQLMMVNSALTKIEDLSAGKVDLAELSSSERDDLEGARDRLDQILRVNNKNRIVCQSNAKLGSRITTTECLTVAQREERASNGRKATANLQTGYCVPGEGNPCGLR